MGLTLACVGDVPTDLAGFHDPAYYRELTADIYDAVLLIQANLTQNVDRAVSRALQGADMCFDVAIDDINKEYGNEGSKVAREVYLPYPGIEGKWPVGGIFGKNAFREDISTADVVHIVNPVAPRERSFTKAALARASRKLVSTCNILLVVTTEDPEHGNRPSAKAWNQATQEQKILCWLNPDNGSFFFQEPCKPEVHLTIE